MTRARTQGRARWRKLSPVGFRRAAAIAALLCLVAAVLSARYRMAVGVRVGGGSRVAAVLDQAQLQCFWFGPDAIMDFRDPTNDGSRVIGWQIQRGWWSGFSLAWRPFHIAQQPFPASSATHGIAIPLWPVLAGSLLLAGYSHGLIVGSRRATIGRCAHCGYDLRSLPPGAVCPECGPAASGKVAQSRATAVEVPPRPVL